MKSKDRWGVSWGDGGRGQRVIGQDGDGRRLLQQLQA